MSDGGEAAAKVDATALKAALSRFDAAVTKVEGAIDALGSGPTSGAEYRVACTAGVRGFMDMKEASRASALEIATIQEVVAKRRKVLDDQHLQSQNFEYRAYRLGEEVRSCRDFKCSQLLKIEADEGASMARFLGNAPIDGTEHADRLKVLQDELETRRRLAAEVEALTEAKRAMEADGKAQRAFLRDLPTHLAAVKRASDPLLPLCAANAGRRRTQSDATVASLPRPLALLYGQLDGLVASGVLDAATSNLRVVAPPQKKDGDDEEEETGAEADFGGVSIARSPASVVVDVDGVPVSFFTVPCLGDCVVVEPSDETLVDLFPGDDGDDLTSAEACQRALALGCAPGAAFPAAALGRPFHWAQWLGGKEPGPLAPGKLAPSSRLVFSRLRERTKAKRALDATLAALAKRPCPKALACFGDWRGKIAPTKVADLAAWAPYEAPHDPFARTSEESLDDAPAHRAYFKATFTTDAKHKVTATVEVAPDYPFRAPRFLLQPRDGSAPTYDPKLKDVETELNAHYGDLVDYADDSKGHLLAHQLTKLAAMLAVLADAKDDDQPTFGRTRRGRDRKRPLVYDPRARANAHRVL